MAARWAARPLGHGRFRDRAGRVREVRAAHGDRYGVETLHGRFVDGIELVKCFGGAPEAIEQLGAADVDRRLVIRGERCECLGWTGIGTPSARELLRDAGARDRTRTGGRERFVDETDQDASVKRAVREQVERTREPGAARHDAIDPLRCSDRIGRQRFVALRRARSDHE